jgi:formate hydrogenlyase subunit 3/multisubunit Na+/H+ antiporter MnhD subunit
MGLIPFNGWMPLTYAAAPIPAAALLSGASVKAGVIGMVRFLPLGIPLEGWDNALVALGFLSAFYGVVFGLTQQNPKGILTNSSISQMGIIAAAVGMALVNGQSDTSRNVAFYAANHMLVKAACS